MNIAVCEDISSHREHLVSLILEFFKTKAILCEISEYSSGEKFLSSDNEFDIVFMDIEVGEINGIEVVSQIKKTAPHTVIIIVTSYPNYLDDAIDLNVARFIQKPAKRENVFSALEKALREIKEKYIVLRTKENEYVRLKICDIVFAEAKFKSVTVVTENHTYVVKDSLTSIKERIASSDFIVPHNSYIVNMNYVSKFQRDEVIVKCNELKETIHISSRRQVEIKQRFFEFMRGEI